MLTGRCWIRWLCAMLVAAMAETAVAGVVVNWSGNYFTGWNPLHQTDPPVYNGEDKYDDPVSPTQISMSTTSPLIDGLEGFSGYISGRAVDDTTAYSPNYVGSKAYAKFYGGHAIVSGDNVVDGAKRMGIEGGGGGNSSPDELHAEVQPNSLEKFAMLAYWKVPSTAISNSSLFTLSSTQDSQGAGGHTLRWVLRQGGVFYISSNAKDFSNNSPYRSVMDSLQWRVYSPVASGFGDAGNLYKVFYDSRLVAFTGAFTNVTDVGFYVEYDRADDLSGNPAKGINYKITGFSLETAPVPEPGTFLLGLAGFGCVALKRWRQRRTLSATDAPLLTEATT